MSRRHLWRYGAALVAGWIIGWSALAAGPVVEVNRASAADLAALPGIGPVLAQRVIEARQARPFTSWADLQARVRGIGPKTAERLSVEGLRVDGSSYGQELARHTARGSTPSSPTETPPPSARYRGR